jgi:hypothetical protein
VNQGTRYEWAIEEEVRLERNRRIEARRFAPDPEPTSAFSILDAIAADPNVAPALRRTLSDVKREEIAADARGEDLWLMRGGRDE